jgi:hypothetical protein
MSSEVDADRMEATGPSLASRGVADQENAEGSGEDRPTVNRRAVSR